MLALSDQQLDIVSTAAHQLPRSLRSAFLQRLAPQLDGREFRGAVGKSLGQT
jgi:hypothetical protein